MSDAPKRRAYSSELRKARAEATRLRIIEATFERLRTTRPIDLSFADIAADAEVSVRTVYRSFPTADELFAAVSDHVFGDVFPDSTTQPRNMADLVVGLKQQYTRLHQDPAIFRLMFAVPSRSRVDLAEALRRTFGRYLDHLSPGDRRAALAILELLGSPYAWDVLSNHWGVGCERGIRAVLVAGQALLEYLERNPEALDPTHPEPPIVLESRVPDAR